MKICPLLEFVLTYYTLRERSRGAGETIRALRFYLQHQHLILPQVKLVLWEDSTAK